MGTNTENGIRIFGITIQIYLNIHFRRSVGPEIVSLSGHRTYLDTGTVHDQVEVWKVQSGASIYDFAIRIFSRYSNILIFEYLVPSLQKTCTADT